MNNISNIPNALSCSHLRTQPEENEIFNSLFKSLEQIFHLNRKEFAESCKNNLSPEFAKRLDEAVRKYPLFVQAMRYFTICRFWYWTEKLELSDQQALGRLTQILDSLANLESLNSVDLLKHLAMPDRVRLFLLGEVDLEQNELNSILLKELKILKPFNEERIRFDEREWEKVLGDRESIFLELKGDMTIAIFRVGENLVGYCARNNTMQSTLQKELLERLQTKVSEDDNICLTVQKAIRLIHKEEFDFYQIYQKCSDVFIDALVDEILKFGFSRSFIERCIELTFAKRIAQISSERGLVNINFEQNYTYIYKGLFTFFMRLVENQLDKLSWNAKKQLMFCALNAQDFKLIDQMISSLSETCPSWVLELAILSGLGNIIVELVKKGSYVNGKVYFLPTNETVFELLIRSIECHPKTTKKHTELVDLFLEAGGKGFPQSIENALVQIERKNYNFFEYVESESFWVLLVAAIKKRNYPFSFCEDIIHDVLGKKVLTTLESGTLKPLQFKTQEHSKNFFIMLTLGHFEALSDYARLLVACSVILTDEFHLLNELYPENMQIPSVLMEYAIFNGLSDAINVLAKRMDLNSKCVYFSTRETLFSLIVRALAKDPSPTIQTIAFCRNLGGDYSKVDPSTLNLLLVKKSNNPEVISAFNHFSAELVSNARLPSKVAHFNRAYNGVMDLSLAEIFSENILPLYPECDQVTKNSINSILIECWRSNHSLKLAGKLTLGTIFPDESAAYFKFIIDTKTFTIDGKIYPLTKMPDLSIGPITKNLRLEPLINHLFGAVLTNNRIVLKKCLNISPQFVSFLSHNPNYFHQLVVICIQNRSYDALFELLLRQKYYQFPGHDPVFYILPKMIESKHWFDFVQFYELLFERGLKPNYKMHAKSIDLLRKDYLEHIFFDRRLSEDEKIQITTHALVQHGAVLTPRMIHVLKKWVRTFNNRELGLLLCQHKYISMFELQSLMLPEVKTSLTSESQKAIAFLEECIQKGTLEIDSISLSEIAKVKRIKKNLKLAGDCNHPLVERLYDFVVERHHFLNYLREINREIKQQKISNRLIQYISYWHPLTEYTSNNAEKICSDLDKWDIDLMYSKAIAAAESARKSSFVFNRSIVWVHTTKSTAVAAIKQTGLQSAGDIYKNNSAPMAGAQSGTHLSENLKCISGMPLTLHFDQPNRSHLGGTTKITSSLLYGIIERGFNGFETHTMKFVAEEAIAELTPVGIVKFHEATIWDKSMYFYNNILRIRLLKGEVLGKLKAWLEQDQSQVPHHNKLKRWYLPAFDITFNIHFDPEEIDEILNSVQFPVVFASNTVDSFPKNADKCEYLVKSPQKLGEDIQFAFCQKEYLPRLMKSLENSGVLVFDLDILFYLETNNMIQGNRRL